MADSTGASLNSSAYCMPESFWYTRHTVYFVSYYVLTPIFFFLGIVGHAFCMAALAKQAKSEAAYAYQIYVEISETGVVIAFALYTLAIKWWSGAESVGVVWYRKSDALMWFAARLATPLLNMFITTSLLLSLSMAIDRTLALYTPFVYKTWNRRLHRGCALIGSSFAGVSTTAFAIMRYQKQPSTDNHSYYQINIDVEYASSTGTIVLANIRNLLRAGAVIALITCNVMIVQKYRSHIQRRVSYRGATTIRADASRSRTERTLTTLAIVESATTAVGILALTSYFLAIFSIPSFTNCGGLLMIPLVDVVLQASNIAKFYIIFYVDNRFRRHVAELLPLCWRGYVDNSNRNSDSPIQLELLARENT